MATEKENLAQGHRARLRKRFMTNGLDTFADYEMIELLLTYAIPRIDVKPAAKLLIRKFGNLRAILHADPKELMQIQNIGENAVSFFKLFRELIPIYHANELSEGGAEIPTISRLMKLFRSRIGSLAGEVLEMVCFDSKLKILDGGIVRLFEGSVTAANVDIRKIVETAISKGAASIALAHNHPSGDTKPSYQDIIFTRRLSATCKPINMNFIEHLVVGKNNCFSFRRDGHFDELYDDSLEEGRLRGNCRVAEEQKTLSDADFDGQENFPAKSAKKALGKTQCSQKSPQKKDVKKSEGKAV